MGPLDLPWPQIAQAAEAGVSERTLLEALNLDEQALRDAGELERFRAEVRTGNAKKRMDLRIRIDERGRRSTKSAGSVNILALEARNDLGWDRQARQQEVEPDLSTAKDRLRVTLEQLAAQRSEIEGREVTVEMLLYREAFDRWPEDQAAAETAVSGPFSEQAE